MKLSSREQDGVVILEPKGKIMGGPDATALRENVRDQVNAEKKQIVIDLAGVDWMNSTGLGILISCLTTLKNADGELKLANVTDKIKSLLTITKLVTVFDAYDSVDEAVSSMKTG
jgi:anti-sigma B factor antagonist